MDPYLAVIIAAVLATIVLLLLRWFLQRRREASGDEREMISLVFLLSQPREIDDTTVRKWASEAFETTFDADNPDATEFVLPIPVPPGVSRKARARARHFHVQVKQGPFLVNHFAGPYMDKPEKYAESIADLRLREAIAAHKAWLSVDVLGEVESQLDKEERYRSIGRMMVHAADDDCLAIYCPELERCNQWDPVLVDSLLGDNPLALFDEATFSPIIGVDGKDPRMVAAVEEAKQRWPEFVAAFRKNTDPDRPFMVKAAFTENDNTEFMWVMVGEIESETIRGRLENQPNHLPSLKEGDQVAVATSALNDWAYVDDNDEPVGCFTQLAIREIYGHAGKEAESAGH